MDNSTLKTRHSTLPAYAGFIRWGFARFYREFAFTYDMVALAVSGGRWFEWGRAALPYLAGNTLELGCGTGHLQARMLAAGQPGVGVDASPQMLAIARARLESLGAQPRLARALAQALPFPTGTFDSVVATFPSEYIVDPGTLREIARVLRPGGRLVVALAASFGADDAYQRLVGLLYRATLQRSPQRPASARPQSLLGGRLAEHGFAAEERWEAAGGGQVHLVVAMRV